MSTPKSKISQNRSDRVRPGFDVTAVIGRVELDETGDMSPGEAAFRLIGLHDAEGVYTFPTPQGGEYVVTVEVHEAIAPDDDPAF